MIAIDVRYAPWSGIRRYSHRTTCRGKLTNAAAATAYSYAFDDIGNRLLAAEMNLVSTYTANALNQYTNILCASVPLRFISAFNRGGYLGTHASLPRYVRRGYAPAGRRIRRRSALAPTLHLRAADPPPVRQAGIPAARSQAGYSRAFSGSSRWDPTEPVATKPFVYRNGTNVAYYLHDGNKNVSALVSGASTVAASYVYAPFGAVTSSSGTLATVNPFRFSSEYADDTLALVYYNYRHYNPADGRWTSRDPSDGHGEGNLFVIADNDVIDQIDYVGQFGLTYMPPPDSTVTPVDLGIEWLTGLGPRHRDFTNGDCFAEQMRSHKNIQLKIKEVADSLTRNCDDNCNFTPTSEMLKGSSASYNLSGFQGVVNYVGDYSTLLTFGAYGNLAVTFTGSYDAVIKITSVSCCQNTADIKIVINNCSHAASASRPPVIGYTSWWQRHVAPAINQLFKTGPASPTTQTITLTETLKFSSKCPPGSK